MVGRNRGRARGRARGRGRGRGRGVSNSSAAIGQHKKRNLIPTLSLAEIPSRKWQKTISSVGHIQLMKWTPVDQEDPTELLQEGVYLKRKSTKMDLSFNEHAPVTRSIRQQFDTPLEEPQQLVDPTRASSRSLSRLTIEMKTTSTNIKQEHEASAPKSKAEESSEQVIKNAVSAPPVQQLIVDDKLEQEELEQDTNFLKDENNGESEEDDDDDEEDHGNASDQSMSPVVSSDSCSSPIPSMSPPSSPDQEEKQ